MSEMSRGLEGGNIKKDAREDVLFKRVSCFRSDGISKPRIVLNGFPEVFDEVSPLEVTQIALRLLFFDGDEFVGKAGYFIFRTSVVLITFFVVENASNTNCVDVCHIESGIYRPPFLLTDA